jgi:asparagine synthase (glutamine-hydrolysing)
MLPDGAGLVWGFLFERATSRRIITPAQFRQPQQPLEDFVERHWGGYLMIRLSGGAVEILRDPSGAIPCYHVRIDGADLFTSRVDLLYDAGLLQPEFDWTIVLQAMVFRDLRPARTPLRGVNELMPGCCATIEDRGPQISAPWSLWSKAAPACEIQTMTEAVEQVKRVTTNCVSAWGRCFERPMLELSGGLDSSILAAVLAQAGCNPLCATFASVAGDPDETPYARAVAEHLGLRLEVLRADISDVDVTRTQARNLPRPAARAFSQAHDNQLRALGQREGIDAFFSGGGGDNVFAYLRSVLPVIDRAKRGGGDLLATMRNVAGMADVGAWHVFAAVLRRSLRLRAARRWAPDERFLVPAALRTLPFPHGHPWVDAPRSVLPGKRIHGHAMIVIQNHLEGFDRLHDASIISPLISQPIVETCMAVPTWLWCDGGMNRAVARNAFADRLPPAVVQRRSKGAFDAYSTQVFLTNRALISEMLLGGTLAQQGLIDTRRIRAAIAPVVPNRPDMLRFLDLADVEAWLAAWSARATERSAA